ncbi:hypothetical protein UFOVP276_135 [uncultured Caudovirales phage]|uniref:Uncharacterized protein n=1 Tax=uncultured Caudovirales phage TaxID=2100421 RepID=A0A6J5LA62_9CAUD|nr:hypothetical protein UFOVP127_29 [uncultured Caudovirales phage]CAB4135179.1 hypothetical protein UFOVP276_135 [uncultured Caudovirales phage]
MAIAVVGTPASNLANSGGPLSITHALTNGSGNNRCVVFAEGGFCSAGGSSGNGLVTGVTYDGHAMTTAGANIESSTGTSAASGVWYILDADLPASAGNYTVTATYQTANYVMGGVVELSGVDQTGGSTTIDAVATLAQPAGSTTSTPSVTVATTDANSLIVDILTSSGQDIAPVTATGTNHTSRITIGSDASHFISMGTMTTTSTGNYTPGWNEGGTKASRQSMAAVAFKAYVSTAAAPAFLLFFASVNP